MFNYDKIGVEDFCLLLKVLVTEITLLKMEKKQIIWKTYKLGVNIVSNINKQHKIF